MVSYIDGVNGVINGGQSQNVVIKSEERNKERDRSDKKDEDREFKVNWWSKVLFNGSM